MFDFEKYTPSEELVSSSKDQALTIVDDVMRSMMREVLKATMPIFEKYSKRLTNAVESGYLTPDDITELFRENKLDLVNIASEEIDSWDFDPSCFGYMIDCMNNM